MTGEFCRWTLAERVAPTGTALRASSSGSGSGGGDSVGRQIFSACSGFTQWTASGYMALLFPLLAVLFSYFIKATFTRYRLTLPYTVPLVLLGGVFGVAGCYLNLAELSASLRLWVNISNPALLYYVLFPPILFESAMYLDWWTIKHTIPHLFSLSILLVFISAAIVAALTTYVFGVPGWSFDAGWVFGALISPTDALAVGMMLAKTPVRKHIQVMIQGEALFNDGSGFTLFLAFLSRLLPGGNSSFGYLVQQLFRLGLGGIAVGIAMGIPTLFLLRYVWRDATIEIGTTLIMSYLVFYVAESPLGVSGIVAVSAFGVVFAADRFASITPALQESLDAFWEVVSHIINSVAFVYAGFISVVNLIVFWGKDGIGGAAIGYGVALYPITYLARLVAVVVLFPVLRTGRYGTTWRESLLIVHSGLRGAISLIAAQIVFHSRNLSGGVVVQARVQLWTSIVVLLTLLFQGTTVRQVARLLGLLRQTSAEVRFFRAQVRRVHQQSLAVLQDMQLHSRFRYADWELVRQVALLPYKLDELLISASQVRALVRRAVAQRARTEEGGSGRRFWPHGRGRGTERSRPMWRPHPLTHARMEATAIPKTATASVGTAKPTTDTGSESPTAPAAPAKNSPLFRKQMRESRRRALSAVRAAVRKQHHIGSLGRVPYRLLDAAIDKMMDEVEMGSAGDKIHLFESSKAHGWGLGLSERLGIRLCGSWRWLNRFALGILYRRLRIGHEVVSGLTVALLHALQSRREECTRVSDLLQVPPTVDSPRVTLLSMILAADMEVSQELERDMQRCEQYLQSLAALSPEAVRASDSLRAAAVLLSRQERTLTALHAAGSLTQQELRGLLDQIDMRREALQRASLHYAAAGSDVDGVRESVQGWFAPHPATPSNGDTDGEGDGGAPKRDSGAAAGTSTDADEHHDADALFRAIRQLGRVRSVFVGQVLQPSDAPMTSVMIVVWGVLEVRQWRRQGDADGSGVGDAQTMRATTAASTGVPDRAAAIGDAEPSPSGKEPAAPAAAASNSGGAPQHSSETQLIARLLSDDSRSRQRAVSRQEAVATEAGSPETPAPTERATASTDTPTRASLQLRRVQAYVANVFHLGRSRTSSDDSTGFPDDDDAFQDSMEAPLETVDASALSANEADLEAGRLSPRPAALAARVVRTLMNGDVGRNVYGLLAALYGHASALEVVAASPVVHVFLVPCDAFRAAITRQPSWTAAVTRVAAAECARNLIVGVDAFWEQQMEAGEQRDDVEAAAAAATAGEASVGDADLPMPPPEPSTAPRTLPPRQHSYSMYDDYAAGLRAAAAAAPSPDGQRSEAPGDTALRALQTGADILTAVQCSAPSTGRQAASGETLWSVMPDGILVLLSGAVEVRVHRAALHPPPPLYRGRMHGAPPRGCGDGGETAEAAGTAASVAEAVEGTGTPSLLLIREPGAAQRFVLDHTLLAAMPVRPISGYDDRDSGAPSQFVMDALSGTCVLSVVAPAILRHDRSGTATAGPSLEVRTGARANRGQRAVRRPEVVWVWVESCETAPRSARQGGGHAAASESAGSSGAPPPPPLAPSASEESAAATPHPESASEATTATTGPHRAVSNADRRRWPARPPPFQRLISRSVSHFDRRTVAAYRAHAPPRSSTPTTAVVNLSRSRSFHDHRAVDESVGVRPSPPPDATADIDTSDTDSFDDPDDARTRRDADLMAEESML